MKKWILTKLAGVFCLILSFILLSAWWESSVVVLADHDYLPQIEALYEEKRYGEALSLAEAVLALGAMPNEAAIQEFVPKIEREKSSYVRKMKDLLLGAISGDGDTGSMLTGSMVADAFVLGDIRDLSIQAWKKVSGQETDEFVALLSVVGIGSSAATFFPEPTSSVAGVTTQAGATTLKFLKKSDALSPSLVKSLKASLRKARAEKDWGSLKEPLQDVGVIVQKSPDGSLKNLFKQIDDPDDLETVARWVTESPARTVAVVETGGKRGMQWMRAGNLPGSNATRTLLRKGAAGFSKVRWFSRPAKFVATGGLIHIQEFLRGEFMQYPTLRRIGGILGLVFLALGVTLAAPKRLLRRMPNLRKLKSAPTA